MSAKFTEKSLRYLKDIWTDKANDARIDKLIELSLSITKTLSRRSAHLTSTVPLAEETVKLWDMLVRSLLTIHMKHGQFLIEERRYLLTQLKQIRTRHGGGVRDSFRKRLNEDTVRLWSGYAEQLVRDTKNNSSRWEHLGRRLWPFGKATLDIAPLAITAAATGHTSTLGHVHGVTSLGINLWKGLFSQDVERQSWVRPTEVAYKALYSKDWKKFTEYLEEHVIKQYHRRCYRGLGWRSIAGFIYPLQRVAKRQNSTAKRTAARCILLRLAFLEKWKPKHKSIMTERAQQAVASVWGGNWGADDLLKDQQLVRQLKNHRKALKSTKYVRTIEQLNVEQQKTKNKGSPAPRNSTSTTHDTELRPMD